MKRTLLNYSVLLFIAFIFNLGLQAQNKKDLWTKSTQQRATQGKQLERKSEPSKKDYYHLDLEALKGSLKNAPVRGESSKLSDVLIDFPLQNGAFETFRITETSILDTALQATMPNSRTYIGQSVKNPANKIRFSITSSGLHTMLQSQDEGMEFTDPTTYGGNYYMIYKSKDLPVLDRNFECKFEDEPLPKNTSVTNSQKEFNASDSKLRTFRLAIATTIEYSEFHWKRAGLLAADTEAAKKDAVMDALIVTMNRVNGVFENELALTMQFVANNKDIIFINSDAFTNNDTSELIDESQAVIDAAILTANYDIGHTFSTSSGGLAYLNSPCTSNRKASGVTGLPSPVGDVFDVGYVAHEMGHQYGAPHTFNGDTGSCAGTSRSANNAYEPGSGTTIMAYAGICAPQNVQANSDPYFHQKSLQMMWSNITTGASTCATQTTLTNLPPVANAGNDYTIPISTPFKLVGNSTDPNGSTASHTYTWEQYDLTTSAGMPLETNTEGPLVRSFTGTSNKVRQIPRFTDYIASGGSTTWEKLPSVNRTMTFALTVRDNNASGGQNHVDFTTITVNSTVPFKVNNPINWGQGFQATVTWDVGQTANPATINCQNVNIKLSTDGGSNFPTTIATNVPNNGSYTFTVPAMPNTITARVLVEAADNIFYDVSDFDFTISPDVEFFIANEVLTPVTCGGNTAEFKFDYVPVNGFNQIVVFSATGNPSGSTVTFSPANLSNTAGTVTATINNLNAATKGNYTVSVVGTSPTLTKTKVLNFVGLSNGGCTSFGTMQYPTSITKVVFNAIDNTSAKPSGYIDYTATFSTTVNRNETYPLTVQVNTAGNYTNKTRVWIDWNQNCSFNDAGEVYDLGDVKNVANGATANSPLSITIPNGAVLGNTVMRVSTKFDGEGIPTSCETEFDGETEDYRITINDPTLAVETLDFENLVVFPNPSKGVFNIKLGGITSNTVQTLVFDISGRKVFSKTFKNSGDFNEEINLNNIASGIYILNITDGLREYVQKIIVE